jgi:hypothetical protein
VITTVHFFLQSIDHFFGHSLDINIIILSYLILSLIGGSALKVVTALVSDTMSCCYLLFIKFGLIIVISEIQITAMFISELRNR